MNGAASPGLWQASNIVEVKLISTKQIAMLPTLPATARLRVIIRKSTLKFLHHSRSGDFRGVFYGNGGIGQSGGRNALPGFDPFGRHIALLLRTIHSERCHQPLPPDPPRTETAGGNVPTVDDLFSVRGIAPELVREIEYIGKEIRNVAEFRA